MRIVLSLLLLLLTSASAYAQTLQIERIDVLEHGIYTADESNCSRDAQGILTCVRSNVRLAAATWTIPAQHGVHFGLRFRVIGVPNGTPISLKRVLIYPPAGLHPRAPHRRSAAGKPPTPRTSVRCKATTMRSTTHGNWCLVHGRCNIGTVIASCSNRRSPL